MPEIENIRDVQHMDRAEDLLKGILLGSQFSKTEKVAVK